MTFFLKSVNTENKSVLVLGAGCEEIARAFLFSKANEVYLIIDEEDSLVQSRFALSKEDVKIRLMEYDNTDFNADKFDIVYAQGSTGTTRRNKIIKEISKILKPAGSLCIGEIVSLTEDSPRFVKNIWENNNFSPLYKEDFKDYYLSKGFELILEEDLSGTLKDFYSKSKELLSESQKDLSDKEKKFFKQAMKNYNHEANAYLKLGGDKYIGYRMVILKNNLKS